MSEHDPETWGYCVTLTWSEEDDGYIATVPALPGCCAFGADRVTAVKEVHDAMRAWVCAAQQMGRALPDFDLIPMPQQ